MKLHNIIRSIFPKQLRKIVRDVTGVTALQEKADKLENGFALLEKGIAQLQARDAAIIRYADNFLNPDVVLVQAPAWGICTPPLGLATLTAYARKRGYKVLPLDLNIESYLAREGEYKNIWDLEQSLWFWNTPSRVQQYIEDNRALFRKFVTRIVATRAKLVGFAVYGSSYVASLYLAKELKAADPEITIVFGGPHVSKFLAGKTTVHEKCVDVVAQGEGELTLIDLIEKVAKEGKVEFCPGTLLRRDGEIIDCGDRDPIANINELPYADFSDYDLKSYRDPARLPIISSRGCVNRCIYCNERPYWRKYRFLRAERIFAEIQGQLAQYPGVDWFDFQDSTVNGNVKELERLADLILANGLEIRWSGQAIIRKEMTLDLLKKLRQSGCVCLAFGLETPSPSLMLKIGKRLSDGANPDQIVRDCHTAGLGCAYNFMFGLPGETEEDARETLDFLRRHRDWIGTVNPSPGFCGFAPGTLAFDRPEEYGIRKDTFDRTYWESDDGKNSYLVRLRRFEEFCQLVDDLGISTTYPSRQLLDRDRYIAKYHHFKKEYEQAIPYFKDWLKNNPKDIEALDNLANCYEKTGSPELAVTMRERARALEG